MTILHDVYEIMIMIFHTTFAFWQNQRSYAKTPNTENIV